jgi:hypothetical protein
LDRMITQAPSNILGVNIRCNGDESSILDCRSDYDTVTGDTMSSCSTTRPAAILCEQGSIQLGDNMKTSTRGLPYLTTKLSSTGKTVQSYFCADNFTDEDARVFCQMKSWKFGKAITLPNETPAGKIHLTGMQCSANEPHVIDCKHGEEANPTCTTAAGVECSPGFPFTLRMFNTLSGKIPPDQLTIG